MDGETERLVYGLTSPWLTSKKYINKINMQGLISPWLTSKQGVDISLMTFLCMWFTFFQKNVCLISQVTWSTCRISSQVQITHILMYFTCFWIRTYLIHTYLYQQVYIACLNIGHTDTNQVQCIYTCRSMPTSR